MPNEPADSSLAAITKTFMEATAPLDDIVKKSTDASLSQYADILLCLSSEAMMAYMRLLKHVEEKNLRYSAFELRNLLELEVWTEYCGKSKENAQRLYDDAVRDVNGIMAACTRMSELVTVLPKSWVSGRITAEESLRRMSTEAGIQELDPNYLSVYHAAKEISPEIGIVFSRVNTILSKFVHPTALSIRTVIPPKMAADFTSLFLSRGTQLITGLIAEVGKAANKLVGD